MPMKNPPHPGASIRRMLESVELSVTRAAEYLDVSRVQLSRLINEKSGISPDMAVRLAKAFGGTTAHWLRLQMAYDLAQAEGRAKTIKVKRIPGFGDPASA